MRSGGDLLVASVHNTYSVDVDQAARDVGEQFGRIEPAEDFSAISGVFQITAVAFSTFLNRLAAAVRSRTAANGDSTGFDVPRFLTANRRLHRLTRLHAFRPYLHPDRFESLVVGSCATDVRPLPTPQRSWNGLTVATAPCGSDDRI